MYDIENVSPLIFYTSYGAQGIFTGYRNIYWERRGQAVEEDHPGVWPRGWLWGP